MKSFLCSYRYEFGAIILSWETVLSSYSFLFFPRGRGGGGGGGGMTGLHQLSYYSLGPPAPPPPPGRARRRPV